MVKRRILELTMVALFLAFGGALPICHVKMFSFEWWLLDGLSAAIFTCGFFKP